MEITAITGERRRVPGYAVCPHSHRRCQVDVILESFSELSRKEGEIALDANNGNEVGGRR